MLAAFLVLSLMAHALCFYVFQIVYPTPVALLPPPARVTFIAPDSEEGRTLLRWIDAEDPAVAFTTHPAPGARLGALPRTEHLPSYSTIKPILKELPPLKPDLRVPSSRPPSAVHTIARKTASARGTARTYISFSKELDQFGAPTVPQAAFANRNPHPHRLYVHRHRDPAQRLADILAPPADDIDELGLGHRDIGDMVGGGHHYGVEAARLVAPRLRSAGADVGDRARLARPGAGSNTVTSSK